MKHSLALSVGLVALTFGVATPAMAQMETPKPAAPEVVSPEATDSATPSVLVEPAPPSAEVMPPATPSATMSIPVLSQPAAPAGFTWPKSPVPVNVGVTYDGPGSLGTGGFERFTAAAGGQSAEVPVLGTATNPASGYGLMAELGLPLVTLGARMQSYGFTSPVTGEFKPPQGATRADNQLGVFFPKSYNEVYANLLGITLGYRNETYEGTGNYVGNYGNLMVGLPLFGINLFDVVGVGVGVKAGYAVSKPEALATTDIVHVPVDGDAHVSFKLAMVRAKLGYKAAAVVNAAPGDLFSALTNPGSLVPTNGNVDQKKLDNLTATRYGLYIGPYMGIELNF